MVDLVQQASRALSANDADQLERLLAEARACTSVPAEDRARLAQAALVLSAQVQAASLHLRMRRSYSDTSSFVRHPWAA